MLQLKNHTENGIEEYNHFKWYFEARLHYFVSEIMEMLDIDDAEEIEASLTRAIQTCGTLQLAFNLNFKRVYRCDGQHVKTDWKLSSLACYLIIINCNPCYERVAKAQLYFVMRKPA